MDSTVVISNLQRVGVMEIVAIIVGPIVAVLITLWYQTRKEKRDVQFKAFLTLMAHRKAMPPTFALCEVLNTIEVVFGHSPKIVHLWHEYFALLCQAPNERNLEPTHHKYLELLSAVADSLGYDIPQVDIDKFYQPQAHADQNMMSSELQFELLRVLKNTARFEVEKK